MSDTKHTEGPWHWEPGSPLITRHWHGKEHTVASVDFRLHWHEDRVCEGREQGANALLMASAPDLLDALAGLLEIEEERIRLGFFTPNASGAQRMEAARAAIAKALGS